VVTRSHASITDPARVGELLRAIDGYIGQPATAAALKLAPLVFVRPGELRAADWSEFDLEAARRADEKLRARSCWCAHIIDLQNPRIGDSVPSTSRCAPADRLEPHVLPRRGHHNFLLLRLAEVSHRRAFARARAKLGVIGSSAPSAHRPAVLRRLQAFYIFVENRLTARQVNPNCEAAAARSVRKSLRKFPIRKDKRPPLNIRKKWRSKCLSSCAH
jgi:hypothetical protein